MEIFTEAVTRQRDAEIIVKNFKRREKLIPELSTDGVPNNYRIRLRKDSGQIFGYLCEDASQKVISHLENGKQVAIEIAKAGGKGLLARKPVPWQLKITFQ